MHQLKYELNWKTFITNDNVTKISKSAFILARQKSKMCISVEENKGCDELIKFWNKSNKTLLN